MVTCHLCLVGYDHGPTVALQAHVRVGFERLFHKSWIANQIHGEVAIQKNDLPEIKFDFGAVRLFEQEFSNLRFKLVLYLSKLKSTVSELKVQCFFRCVGV
jgi:hypothetical protein